jgi:serine/threonine protein kinase
MGENAIRVRAMDQARDVYTFHLHLDEQGLPEVLGTGRNAVVFLATTTHTKDSPAAAYRAIKFVRDDVDKQYAYAIAKRFFAEADKAQRFHRLQETFVKYYGWGAVRTPDEQSVDPKGRRQDFWWEGDLLGLEDQLVENDAENQKRLLDLLRHFKLQGPFYVLDLCQGTLYDLLDKSTPWIKLPAYSISTYQESLLQQSDKVAQSITDVARTYLERAPGGRSGYGILNMFKRTPEANRLRSRAVLQIFEQVADTVAQLHRKRAAGGRGQAQEPLAHRDLKPGNVFFQHDATIDGLRHIKVQLSDLGYVTTPDLIQTGDATLRGGKKGAEYQAPGSQFYRAPEQAELPIEVRVDIIAGQRDRVRVRGSKIDRIDIHDWLMLSDIFSNSDLDYDLSDTNLFKIKAVETGEDDSGAFYDLRLSSAIDTSRPEDVQAQIVRSTGFQTDGFSLGAILYDMISGGKDPQQFYIYCIVSLAGEAQSIQEIVNILAPALQPDGSSEESLNLSERRLILSEVIQASDLDDLFGRIQHIAFNKVEFQNRPKLKPAEKFWLANEVRSAEDIDELVNRMIKSELFANLPKAPNSGQQIPDESRLDKRLRSYRFRNFTKVSDLLCDRRGVPIPRDILHVIVACMVRDMEGSYYKNDRDLGYTSDFNFDAATRIHSDVLNLLSTEEYQLPKAKDGFPELLAEDLLFKLRSLALDNKPRMSHGKDDLP